MSTRTAAYIRQHHLALIALFFALTGAAWATHPDGANTISSEDIINGEVRTDDLRDGDIKTADINNNNGVRSEDVRDDTLADGGLASVDIAPDALTGADIAESDLDSSVLQRRVSGSCPSGQAIRVVGQTGTVTCQSVGGAPSGPAGGDLAGTYPDPAIAADAVGSNEVATDSLGAADIAPDSLGGSELADNSVRSANVFPSTLTGTDIAFNTLTSSDIATGAVGTAELASSIPAVHVTRTGNQTIEHNMAYPSIKWNSERYDTAGMHSNSTDNTRITAPVTGIYAVTVSYVWAANGFGMRGMGVSKNASGWVGAESQRGHPPGNGEDDCCNEVNFSTVLRLEAGDFLEVDVYQNSHFDLDILKESGAFSPEFTMTWLAPGP